MRQAKVMVNETPAGILEENKEGFIFRYYNDYIANDDYHAISLTLPKQNEPYSSPILFPFFAGLLTEGTTMQIQCQMLKIDQNDLFGRLLKTAHDDVIGNVTIHEIEKVAL